MPKELVPTGWSFGSSGCPSQCPLQLLAKPFPCSPRPGQQGKEQGTEAGTPTWPPATQTWMELTVRTLQPGAWGPAGVRAPQAPPISLREGSACCGLCTFCPSLPQALWGGHRPTPWHLGQDSIRAPPEQDPVSPVLGVMGSLGDFQLL